MVKNSVANVVFVTIATLGLALFMIRASYYSGLFFDKDFYSFHLVLYPLTFITIVYLKLKRKAILTDGIGLPFMMCFVYLVPLWLSAESIMGTIEQIMRWTSYGCFFLLLYHFAKKPQHRHYLHYAFQGIGLCIVIGAFLGFYGMIDFKDIVLYTEDERLSVLGLRLTGFFQYANTFAVFLAAFLLYNLMALVKDQNWISSAVLSVPLVP